MESYSFALFHTLRIFFLVAFGLGCYIFLEGEAGNPFVVEACVSVLLKYEPVVIDNVNVDSLLFKVRGSMNHGPVLSFQ